MKPKRGRGGDSIKAAPFLGFEMPRPKKRPKLELLPTIPRTFDFNMTLEEAQEQEKNEPLTVRDGYFSLFQAASCLRITQENVGPMHLQTPEFRYQISRIRQMLDELTV